MPLPPAVIAAASLWTHGRQRLHHREELARRADDVAARMGEPTATSADRQRAIRRLAQLLAEGYRMDAAQGLLEDALEPEPSPRPARGLVARFRAAWAAFWR